MTRKLIVVPVIHTTKDFGSYLEIVKKQYIEEYGTQNWEEHLKSVEVLWQYIETQILSCALTYSKIRLYQDGLPVGGHEKEVVEQLANDGSRNHQLLYTLMQKGATLMGTENLSLLLEERERLLKMDTHTELQPQDDLKYNDLIERRDQFIAKRIDETLVNDETGILFVGALHRIADKLPKDIEVQTIGYANKK